MKKIFWLGVFIAAFVSSVTSAQEKFETDTIKTSAGDLNITFIGHGTLMFTFQGKVVHVDPWTDLADYSGMPKADLILVTHEHRDHLDPKAIDILRAENTGLILTRNCANQVSGGMVMNNGDVKVVKGFSVEAVPAYNIVHMRAEGVPFHPKGSGNGYVIAFGELSVYVAGDTENIPEMNGLKNIDIAFLPMNLPYTMTPEMVADAARALQPKILYPYHYGNTDTATVASLLKDNTQIEVRIRNLR